jgi:hypothetical protein
MFGWVRNLFRTKALRPRGLLTREYNTNIVGIEFVPAGVELVRRLKVGDEVKLVRQPDNPHDKNAIVIIDSDGNRLGYLSAKLAADISRALDEDEGKLGRVVVTEKLAEGRDRKRFGAVITFVLVRRRRR